MSGHRFFWDQNVFNKALLSFEVQHEVKLPDNSDHSWTANHTVRA